MITPHDYQSQAVQDARCALKLRQRVLVTSPPGSGKTVMIALLARISFEQDRRVLIIAQRREILQQTHNHLHQLGVAEADIGAIYPEPDAAVDLTRPIQIASAATLMRRDLHPVADTIILDEAHHAVADGHRGILEAYLHERVVGFTATPIRMDGRGLGDIFDTLIIAAKPSALIQRNLLANPRCFSAPEEFLPNLVGIRRALGDFTPAGLDERINRETLVGNIVNEYQKRAGDHTALVFAATLEHSRHIVARFNAAGVPAEHLDGEAPMADRDAIVDRLRKGVTRVVSNMGILHEGFDLPRTYAVVLARPTLSLCLYLQQTGRALRRYGNRRPLILDHARNVIRFGLPEADREFSLTETITVDERGSALVRRCEQCGALYAASCKACPECGFVAVEPAPIPEETDVDLTELTLQERQAFEQQLDAFLQRRGDHDPAWRARVIELWTAYRSCPPPSRPSA